MHYCIFLNVRPPGKLSLTSTISRYVRFERVINPPLVKEPPSPRACALSRHPIESRYFLLAIKLVSSRFPDQL